jgi:Methane oxygenase PmoA
MGRLRAPHLLGVTLLSVAVGALRPSAGGATEPVELRRDGSHVEVLIGGRLFTTYYFDAAVAKAYFFPLRSAQGAVVTRGFPMTSDIAGEDRDEPHQRAMYFAHGDINGFDFWGEAAFPRWSDHAASTFGRTVFRSLDEMRGNAHSSRLRATFDLVAPSGPIAEETQTFEFSGGEASRIIDCEFAIRASRGALSWAIPRRAPLRSAS